MLDSEIKRRIRETREILEECNIDDHKYFTVLLNSLLSLVVLPIEQIKRQKGKQVFNGRYTEFLKTVSITPIVFSPIKKLNEDGTVENEKRLISCFVRKLRNSVAHQNIEFIDGEEETYIRFYNVASNNSKAIKKYSGNCKIEHSKLIDFEIKINAIQLKKLAIYIANKYLEGTANG